MPARDRSLPGRDPIKARLDQLDGGLIVSCQARPGNPLHGPEPIALLARAAELGGARGLRIESARDITAVQRVSTLPIIGIRKTESADSPVVITPTRGSAREILATGVDLVALDATDRPRPGGEALRDVVREIHRHGAVALGDLATIDDLGPAVRAGVDAVGTTLSGYTAESPASTDPDFDLLRSLVKHAPVPVFAEGRFWTPDQVVEAFALGASFVVVGTAITNPMAIASRFTAAIDRFTHPER
ncbi:MAG: N-acetylmannosamine-6-phosphate 2-epimerase [uncultured Thermomicrobiales bacterium]|uniref:Putative N-acetylmannosamine-6-phosphate 2-epimerase n=1 Tax=uncultured Thermomicrobiales bacterium TaxID=1645740 RepID=A0A6J4URG2_9BACT|nr:MAG: N-acetylmannosamine-6-phosphate 2-epimerase [uncultured Thermomicrobiales bacterium]